MTFVCTCLDVKTGQNGGLLSNRHRKKTPSCNRFLSSSVCMSDLAWRRTEQAHRPIRSVGHKCIDQSKASVISESTNQKRPQGTAQAYKPSKSFTKQRRRRSTNQISSGREHWRRPRHARRTDFLRTDFLSLDSSSSQNHRSANQIPPSE